MTFMPFPKTILDLTTAEYLTKFRTFKPLFEKTFL